jgi:hypothetical protein
MRFYSLYKRWPTWADAIAHCPDYIAEAWKIQLQFFKQWNEPENGEEIIAERYGGIPKLIKLESPLKEKPNESEK